MEQCRIIVTTECNLKCSYCLMENPEVRESIGDVPATMADILSKNYDVYCLTGGEIFHNKKRLYSVLTKIRERDMDAKIYLYTNGTLIDKEDIQRLRYVVDGINWGLHGAFFPQVQEKMKLVNQYIPVRILRLDVYRDLHRIRDFAKRNGMTYRVVEKDRCDTIPEDRYILNGDV